MIGSSLSSKTECLLKPSLNHSLYSSITHFLSEFFNKSMRESWLIKKSMSQIMSSSLTEQYELIDKLIPNNWIRLIGAGNGGYFLISSKIEEDKIRNLSMKNGLKGIFKAKPSDEGLTAHTI